MQYLETDQSDDMEFAKTIEKAISGTVSIIQPDLVFVVKIDNWFGDRWLGFSHVVMGAFGVAFGNLSIPPFVPERVASQKCYVRNNKEKYSRELLSQPLHIKQTSEANTIKRRKVRYTYPSAAFFWWGGNSKLNGRGCLMSYLPSTEGHSPWYVGYALEDQWAVKKVRGITHSMYEAYEKGA